MGILALIATAFGLGLLFNAAPGPVFAATVQAGIRGGGGFKPALAGQLGSIVGDGARAVLGLAGVGALLQLEGLRVALGAGGVLYLLWLAWQSWRASCEEVVVAAAAPAETRRAWRSGVMLSLTNPQNLGYWAAIGSVLGALGIGADARRLRRVFRGLHVVVRRMGVLVRCARRSRAGWCRCAVCAHHLSRVRARVLGEQSGQQREARRQRAEQAIVSSRRGGR